jgi:hypothetical protein
MNITNPLPLRANWNETFDWNETSSAILSLSPNSNTTINDNDDDAINIGWNYTHTYPPNTTTSYDDPEYYDPEYYTPNDNNTMDGSSNYVAQHNMIVVGILIGLIVVLCMILGFVALPPIIAMIQRKMPIPQKRIDRRYATIDGWLITKVRYIL